MEVRGSFRWGGLESLSEKVLLKLSPEGQEGAGCSGGLRTGPAGRRSSGCKGPEVGMGLVAGATAARPVWLERTEEKGEGMKWEGLVDPVTQGFIPHEELGLTPV